MVRYEYERVSWSKYDEMGYTRNYGATHLVEEGDDVTLCGRKVPSFSDGYDVTDHGEKMCKRCLKASYAKKDVDMDEDE